MRPAWASTWRWKSSRELVTASEANRRASDREDGVKEAGSEAAGRRTGTGIEGGAEQGERATSGKALVTKARRRRSGGRAAKADVLTRGGLALCPKGRRGPQGQRSEKSAEAIVVRRSLGEGGRRAERWGGRDAHAPRRRHATEIGPKFERTNGRRGEAARAALACGSVAGWKWKRAPRNRRPDGEGV